MTVSDRLRQLVAALPAGASVTLPVAELRAWLDEEGPGAAQGRGETREDLTIEETAERVRRAPSTVRGWLTSGLIPEAYKLRGRDWRIPPGALTRFLEREAEGKAGPTLRPRRGKPDLGEWKKHMPRQARG